MHFYLEMWKYACHIKQRSDDQRIGHEHRPNANAFLMGTQVTTNRWGHRDHEIRVERQPGVQRIVMLGDSFVEGWGVPLQDTVSKRLERMFERQLQPVEVMNTGVGNYNTVMAIQAFLSKDARFKPDMVVLNFTFNDAEPVPSYEAAGLLARNSQAYTVLHGGLDAVLRLVQVRQPWDQYYLSLYDTRGWEVAKSAIHELAQYCRGTGTKLLIVNWPELHDVQNYRLQEITDRVRRVAAAEVIPFVDLLDAVITQESSKLWVTRPDPHPNSFANALYAEHLFPLLARMLRSTMPS
jgi:lysophospholipase L1-like esterase